MNDSALAYALYNVIMDNVLGALLCLDLLKAETFISREQKVLHHLRI